MFNKIKNFLEVLKAYNEIKLSADLFAKQIAFKIERFIQQQNNKRRDKMTQDSIAKEMLLYDDCYIIPKEELKEYISKEFI